MNRRDFIRGVFGALCGVAIDGLIDPVAKAAAWYRQIDGDNLSEGIDVAETYLSFGKMDIRPVTDSIVIHHIGNTDKDVCAADVHKWHLERGWSGIGYHYLIRKDGTIERGRPRDMVGAHCLGENNHTIGVNIVGNFEQARPTSAQLDSASLLIAGLCRLYGIVPSPFTVRGHCDYCDTACPGYYMYNEMSEIWTSVARKVGTDENFARTGGKDGQELPVTPGKRRKKRSKGQNDEQAVQNLTPGEEIYLPRNNEHAPTVVDLTPGDGLRPGHPTLPTNR